MQNPVRILHWGLHDNIGGVETFVMNVYRQLDKSQIQFDFLIDYDANIAFEDEIIAMGGRIYRVLYPKRQSIVKHYYYLYRFFKEHATEYKGLHMHLNFKNFIAPLIYAKRFKIPIRIAHSHNAGNMHVVNTKHDWMYRQNEIKIRKVSTHLLACSELAGNWMFHSNSFEVVNNGIDTNTFRYDKMIRKQVRNELGIEHKKVIGFVGRLQYQKNPEFVVEIFHEIHKKDEETVLILVGDGPDRNLLEKKVSDLGLRDSVIFLGVRQDIPRLLQSFDLFLLPSRFEGLGIVLIEAQATGLPCLTSKNVVPEEANVTDLLTYISLEELPEIWANIALEQFDVLRENQTTKIFEQNYDVAQTVEQLQNLYLMKVEK